MSERYERITVWLCDECGYWRKDQATGVHQTSNPDNPRGRMVVHELRAVEFTRSSSVSAGRVAGDER
jgi:hypothetical protein